VAILVKRTCITLKIGDSLGSNNNRFWVYFRVKYLSAPKPWYFRFAYILSCGNLPLALPVRLRVSPKCTRLNRINGKIRPQVAAALFGKIKQSIHRQCQCQMVYSLRYQWVLKHGHYYFNNSVPVMLGGMYRCPIRPLNSIFINPSAVKSVRPTHPVFKKYFF